MESLGRAAARLQLKKRTHIGNDHTFLFSACRIRHVFGWPLLLLLELFDFC